MERIARKWIGSRRGFGQLLTAAPLAAAGCMRGGAPPDDVADYRWEKEKKDAVHGDRGPIIIKGGSLGVHFDNWRATEGRPWALKGKNGANDGVTSIDFTVGSLELDTLTYDKQLDVKAAMSATLTLYDGNQEFQLSIKANPAEKRVEFGVPPGSDKLAWDFDLRPRRWSYERYRRPTFYIRRVVVQKNATTKEAWPAEGPLKDDNRVIVIKMDVNSI